MKSLESAERLLLVSGLCHKEESLLRQDTILVDRLKRTASYSHGKQTIRGGKEAQQFLNGASQVLQTDANMHFDDPGLQSGPRPSKHATLIAFHIHKNCRWSAVLCGELVKSDRWHALSAPFIPWMVDVAIEAAVEHHIAAVVCHHCMNNLDWRWRIQAAIPLSHGSVMSTSFNGDHGAAWAHDATEK